MPPKVYRYPDGEDRTPDLVEIFEEIEERGYSYLDDDDYDDYSEESFP